MATTNQLLIAEYKEFAGFAPCEQRYIKRSLDIKSNGEISVFRHWCRDRSEEASIRAQIKVYERLRELREKIPRPFDLSQIEPFMAPLIFITAFDLGQEQLRSFNAYRFLYERLLAPTVRPVLPSAFCAAAMVPTLKPGNRKNLLLTITEAVATAPGWSERIPTFIPEWVEKEPTH